MTKKILMLAFCVLLCNLSVGAQTYKSLWSEVKQMREKDRPKSVISLLHQIQTKAEKERSYGNLMASWLVEFNSQQEVSQDSAVAMRERLLAKEAELRNVDGVATAILHTVMFKYAYVLFEHEQQQWALSLKPDVDSLLQSADAAVYTRMNSTEDYLPLVQKNGGSRYFNHDLLSLIGYETEQFAALRRYYSSQNNAEAVAILDQRIFDMTPHETPREQVEWIDSMLTRWGNWEGVNELRTRRDALVNPKINAVISNIQKNSEESILIRFGNIRNLKKVNLSVTRLNLTGNNVKENTPDDSEYAKLKKYLLRKTTKSYSHEFEAHEEYVVFEDSMLIEPLPLGVYLAEITSDCKDIPVQRFVLRITDLMVITTKLPNDIVRFVVVDARNGKPVPYAYLHISNNRQNTNEKIVVTDEKGEYRYKTTRYDLFCRATTDNDNAQKMLHTHNAYYVSWPRERKTDNIFTDRSIYRPGQTVRIALVASKVQNMNDEMVRSNEKIKLQIFDAEYKQVMESEQTTDEYGTFAVDFVIPEVCKNGMYTITTSNGFARFRVEEYKRPTFDVTISKPTDTYKAGDTLFVRGTAMTYSGVPVTNAKVIYEVVRRSPIWFRMYQPGKVMNPNTQLFADTIKTDADGSFTLRMPMIMDEEGASNLPRFYNISAEVTVTDLAGETHSANISMPLSNREAYVSWNVPQKHLADSTLSVRISRVNPVGEPVDGRISLYLDGDLNTETTANTTIELNIKSGKHTLMAICEGDTLKQNFIAFSMSDKHPVEETHDWWYEQTDAEGTGYGGATIQFGTSDREKYVYYTVISKNKLIESGQMVLDSALYCKRFTIDSLYGEPIRFVAAWVHNGKMYHHETTIQPQYPDKKLALEWESFRDKTVPGTKEEWKLRIKNPDGTPARSQLMCTMFDKSLDAITKHNWQINDHRAFTSIISQWKTRNDDRCYIYADANMNGRNLKSLEFSCFNADYMPVGFFKSIRIGGYGGKLMAKQMAMTTLEVPEAQVYNTYSARVYDAVADSNAPISGLTESAVTDDSIVEYTDANEPAIRENFSETALFLSSVETDVNGIAALSFTLPESVTTWRFMGLAHTPDWKTGRIDAEVVAQKQIMVQPYVPRFLRKGDVAVVPATVSNLTNDDTCVEVTFILKDLATERVLYTQKKKINVKANSSEIAEFNVDSRKYDSEGVAITVTATNGKHSDGERHQLPIIINKECIVNTIPLVLRTTGEHNVNITDLIPRDADKAELTVSYTNDPRWNLLEALPYVKETVDDNAISLVSAFYTNSLAQFIASTDSATAARYDRNVLDYRTRDIIERLSSLQLSDGSWSWWKGMCGSRYITMEVLRTLVRLENAIGKQPLSEPLIERAFNYVDAEVAKDIRRMKESQRKGTEPWLSDFHVDYLYCQSLCNRHDNQNYLLPLLEKSTVASDMATKAKAAFMLSKKGMNNKAAEFMTSIMEHTVYREDMGRYFDSYRAAYSWCDYRIPTHAIVTETLQQIGMYNYVDDMRRWLLASKRTQSWDTPINAVNAIHAFFGGKAGQLEPNNVADLKLDRKTIANNSPIAINPGKHQVTINKTSNCESWASVMVSFMQPNANIETSASGMTVKREILGADGKHVSGKLTVGDKVLCRITVVADRDYDFVTVTDKRPAALEPVNQLSGYRNGAYTVQHDSETQYCFDIFAKGQHVIETEYYVVRQGDYQSGTTTAVCTYAPEFQGRDKAQNLAVVK